MLENDSVLSWAVQCLTWIDDSTQSEVLWRYRDAWQGPDSCCSAFYSFLHDSDLLRIFEEG